MKLIGQNGTRRLYVTSKSDPEGVEHVYFVGLEHLVLPDGSTKDLPGDNRWWNEEEAKKWLSSS